MEIPAEGGCVPEIENVAGVGLSSHPPKDGYFQFSLSPIGDKNLRSLSHGTGAVAAEVCSAIEANHLH